MKASFGIILTALFSWFILHACMSQEQQEKVLQNSEPQSVDVTVNVGGDSRAERFLGTFDQISRLSLDIDRNYGNKRVLTDFPLEHDGSKWTGTIDKLIVGFDYTITGHAYKCTDCPDQPNVPDFDNYTVTTFVGLTGISGLTNGLGVQARLNNPHGISVDSLGNIYVSDYSNNVIRKIDPSGNVTTFAGSGTSGSNNGQGTSASFYKPYGSVVDNTGNVFVVDNGNRLIRKIDPSGNVTTFAGNGTNSSIDGHGTSASFHHPLYIALDNIGNLYVSDFGSSKIRKITPTGYVTTYAGTGSTGSDNGQSTSASFNKPHGLVFDSSSNLFIADTLNHTIRKIDPSGYVTTYAGTPGVSGTDDGQGMSAKFNKPGGIAIDSKGNLFVADYNNNLIRKIDTSANVSTIAGTGNVGSDDGFGVNSSFNVPKDVAIDNFQNLYVTDQSNTIRKLTGIGSSAKNENNNQTYQEIFRGETQHTVTEGTNSLNLRLSPLLDDRELTVPRITRINRPFQMVASTSDNITVAVDTVKKDGSSAVDATLSYRFRSVDNDSLPLDNVTGGSFSPASGDVTKSASSYPDISTTYTAPDNDSKLKLQVRVSNELEIGVTSHFNVYVTDDIETQNTIDTNPVIENISAERLDNGDLKWTMNISNDDGFNGLKVKWEYLFGDNRSFTSESNTVTQGDSNRGVMEATMSGYKDSDDGMLLVTVCEDGGSVGIPYDCAYMNEASTSISMELIPGAYNKPIICDGNSCSNDYEGTWIACNTNRTNPGGDNTFLARRDTLVIGSGKGTKTEEYLVSDNGSCEGPVALTMRYEGNIVDNGSKKYVTLGEDNVSSSMYELHFQSTHLSFNDLSYINGLKPNDQTYLCGKSYWTGVEHEVSGCNFKYYSVFDNGTVRKAVSYVADNGTFWTNDDNSSYPDSFGCTRFALESSGNYIYPACVSSSSGSSSNDNTTTSDNSTDNTSSSTPHPLDNITGLALWLDASNIDGNNNSSLSDGDVVGVWKDLSGNGHNADDSISVNQPSLKTNVIGADDSNPAVFFDASENEFLTTVPFGTGSNLTMIAVYNYDSSIAETDKGYFYRQADNFGEHVMGQTDANQTYSYFYSATTNRKHGSIYRDGVQDGVDAVMAYGYYSGEKKYVNNNGYNSSSEITTDIVDGTIGARAQLIGAHGNALNDPNNWTKFTGYLAELIVIDGKVTKDQMIKINQYLAVKWNLTSTVDSDGDGLMDADDPEPTVKRDITIVAVGYNGEIITSIDGENWTPRSSGTSNSFNDVTFGNNNFVAVGYSGTILSSTDGISWTPKTSGTTKRLYGVTYGNNIFVAVGESGTLLTSEDGSSWTSRTSGTTLYILQATYGNGTFVVVGNSGKILTSTDGISWTSRTSGTTSHLQGVTYKAGKYVAVGQSGRIITSSDGVSWTLRTSGISTYLFGITYGNNKYVTVGEEGKILTSSDGISWTSRTSGTTNRFVGVGFVDDIFLAVGESGIIFTSPDGITWTSQNSGTSEYIRRLTND